MGIFSSYAKMSGLSESSNLAFSDAELQETMDMLEDMQEATMPDNLEDCFIEAAVANEHNFNAIMMSVANEEMNYFMENGTEMVYEEGKVAAFFDKIKAFIKKAWEKIKAIFNKAKAWIESKLSSDKHFLKKYGDTIKNLNADECKITGYNINMKNVHTPSIYTGMVENANDAMSWEKGDNAEEILDQVRGDCLGKTEIKSSEFSDELEKFFGISNGNDSVKMDGTDVYEEIASGKLTKKSIDSGYNLAKKSVAALMHYADSLAKIGKKAADAKYQTGATKGIAESNSGMGTASKVLHGMVSILSAAQSKHIRALNILHSQARRIAGNAVKAGSKEKTSTSESASFDAMFI